MNTAITSLLPDLRPSPKLRLGRTDLLIAAGGFEDRTLASVKSVSSCDGANAIILKYQPPDPRNRLSELLNVLSKKGFSRSGTQTITYNRFQPGSFPGRLESAI